MCKIYKICFSVMLLSGVIYPMITALAETKQTLTISLLPQEGEPIAIGNLHLTPETNGFSFQVELTEDLFSDHFLSMRPFRCLEGNPKYMLCYLDYPYQNNRQINQQDLTDLEYDLLFIRKYPSEFGIDAWNGSYYRLQWSNDEEMVISGAMHEVDLNLLAVPPEAGNTRPIGEYDLTPADPASHWLPGIVIR